jgi:hypothetical protein
MFPYRLACWSSMCRMGPPTLSSAVRSAVRTGTDDLVEQLLEEEAAGNDRIPDYVRYLSGTLAALSTTPPRPRRRRREASRNDFVRNSELRRSVRPDGRRGRQGSSWVFGQRS